MNTKPSLLRFLLVDDDDDHAEIVTRSLRRERISNGILRFPDGVEALKYLRREGEHTDAVRPDVILLDLKLPKMDGHQVLAELKADKELMGIPVVILTTSNAEIDRCKAYTLHANSYLVKPIDIQSFCKMVQDLSLYWGIWNTPATGANEG
jgi:CheY-like chemotaxis protein